MQYAPAVILAHAGIGGPLMTYEQTATGWTPESGATTDRSLTPSVGAMFFDTTLGYTIWWSAALGYWVNAAGVGPQ